MSKPVNHSTVFAKSHNEVPLNAKITPKQNEFKDFSHLNPESGGFPKRNSSRNQVATSQNILRLLENESQSDMLQESRQDYDLSSMQSFKMEKIGKFKNVNSSNCLGKFGQIKYNANEERRQNRKNKAEKSDYLKAKLLQLQLIKTNLNVLKDSMHKTLDSSREILGPELPVKNQYYLNDLLLQVQNQPNQTPKSFFFQHFNTNYTHFATLHQKSQSQICTLKFTEINRIKISSEQNFPKLILDLDNNSFFKIKKFTNASSGHPIYLKSEKPGVSYKFQLLFRTYMKKFLSECSKKFEIVILSSEDQWFVKQIVSYMDSQKILISKILYSQQKPDKSKFILKDIAPFNFDMKKTLIVSNRIYSYPIRFKNIIPLVPFKESTEDKELEKLERYLRYLSNFIDLASSNGIYFKYENFTRHANSKELTFQLIRSVLKQ